MDGNSSNRGDEEETSCLFEPQIQSGGRACRRDKHSTGDPHPPSPDPMRVAKMTRFVADRLATPLRVPVLTHSCTYGVGHWATSSGKSLDLNVHVINKKYDVHSVIISGDFNTSFMRKK